MTTTSVIGEDGMIYVWYIVKPTLTGYYAMKYVTVREVETGYEDTDFVAGWQIETLGL